MLKNINLTLKRGENLVVLGRSGQGKSVTIKCISGLLMHDEGECKVFGDEVSDMNDTELKDLRVKVGFLFQSGALYDSMSVRDNLEEIEQEEQRLVRATLRLEGWGGD